MIYSHSGSMDQESQQFATPPAFVYRPSRLILMIFLFTCFLLACRTAVAQYSYPLAENPVVDIFFANPLHGWIVKSEHNSSILLHTDDGGDSWSRFAAQPPIYKLFFLNPNHGWALAVDWPQPDAPLTTLFETRDGGQTWSRKSILLPAKPNRGDMILDLWFLDDNRGWFVGQGELGAALAFKTTDGGQSVHAVPQISTDGTLHCVYGRDKTRLWIFGSNTITATFDGGRTWQSQLDPTRFSKGFGEIGLRFGVVRETGVGWACGYASGAIILTTRDFGKTWDVSFQSAEGNSLDSISFRDEMHGCAVGGSTTLYCTDDEGHSWTARHVLPKAIDAVASAEGINVDNAFKKTVMLNSTRGWVLSEAGGLFETNDGGASWREVKLEK